MKAKKVHARMIYDSRGFPTVEVDLTIERGVIMRASVPSGTLVGKHEALELRDKDPNNFHGQGVAKALKNINEVIGPALVSKGIDVTKQNEVDKMMIALDGTDSKCKLGANAILAVSVATIKSGAMTKNMALWKYIAHLAGVTEVIMPVPVFTVINGGRHAGNKLAFQEFMLMPTGAKTFAEAMKMGSETYHHARLLVKSKYGRDAINVGDEGGFTPGGMSQAEEALDLLKTAIEKANCVDKVKIAIDANASEFYKDKKYNLDYKSSKPDPAKSVTSDQLLEMYKGYCAKYPIFSIEDPFECDDWAAWTKITAALPNVQIVGDDLLVTNPKRVKEGQEKKACNCLLLKINQVGTMSESIEACKIAKAAGWGIMVSHRSGDTEDPFIADMCVGLNAGQIKTGAPCRSERLTKYNQLMRIEEELGGKVKYAGENCRKLK